jgi:hypothetical protein
MLSAAVVLRWAIKRTVVVLRAIKRTVLVMLWALVLATLGAAFIGSGSDKLGINDENRSG